MINLVEHKILVKTIRFKMSMLLSDLCDYFDAYIVIKGTITDSGANHGDRKIEA